MTDAGLLIATSQSAQEGRSKAFENKGMGYHVPHEKTRQSACPGAKQMFGDSTSSKRQRLVAGGLLQELSYSRPRSGCVGEGRSP